MGEPQNNDLDDIEDEIQLDLEWARLARDEVLQKLRKKLKAAPTNEDAIRIIHLIKRL